jgi:hypothetical protein
MSFTRLLLGKIYNSMEELQTDLDSWIDYYNKKRTHQGKMCFGRTPWQTFLDGKEIVKQKILNKEITEEVFENQIIN